MAALANFEQLKAESDVIILDFHQQLGEAILNSDLVVCAMDLDRAFGRSEAVQNMFGQKILPPTMGIYGAQVVILMTNDQTKRTKQTLASIEAVKSIGVPILNATLTNQDALVRNRLQKGISYADRMRQSYDMLVDIALKSIPALEYKRLAEELLMHLHAF